MGKKSRKKKRFRKAWRESGRQRERFARARNPEAARRLDARINTAVIAGFCVLWLVTSWIEGSAWAGDAGVAVSPARVFFALGSLLAGLAAWSVVRQRRVRRWPAVPCVIEAQDLLEDLDRNGRRAWHPLVHYTYEVGGVAYRSSRIRLEEWGYRFRAPAIDRMARYEAGATRTCYHDPRKPARAVLERESSFVLTTILASGAAACFAAAYALA